ncbi:deoxyribodipyrimidine photo-lyase [Sphingobacterium lactis]|uniref:Deoxyribodipyrimidine photo-lyase n=1 Tax=Sphingobacterium lactis TaxID=797291 RepID=A0A1H6BY76_9SPHI|nr:deoxyribodipyrimidine photo-lyase [Sphingobacterium lactis]SEG65116.1 deoxyribodipyrimidine photo-lyase [Sphingobacterium lactis]
MSKKVVLVWFRNDLRLHDNEVLAEAILKSDLIIPVYCFDTRYFQKNNFDHYNTGTNRTEFLIQSVTALKNELKAMGSDLMTFIGYPEEILPKLCAKYEVDEVYHHREVASRETDISEKVEEALWENKINLRHFIGHTLFHKEDLPFPIKDIPDKFNIFRKKVERESHVRAAIPAPAKIISPQHLEETAVPTLAELGFSAEEVQSTNLNLKGGEGNAIAALERLLDPEYQGIQNFTSISPYIAVGALSPIYVYQRMQESNLIQNKKRYERLMNMLFWRDYFRFMLKKYPNIFFKKQGIQQDIKGTDFSHPEHLERWKNGTTGEDSVDKLMKALRETGNLTYAERRLVSKYFTAEVDSNWLIGASYFEEQLLDYAPATTYGFWAHISGVGTSPKENSTPSWQEFAKKIQLQKQ